MNRALIDIANLVINPEINPRHDQADVADLVAQIRHKGFNHPLLVREVAGIKFEVIDGSRRLKAFTQLVQEGAIKNDQISCDVIEADDDTAREIALGLNWARLQLSPADEAVAFYKMRLSGVEVPTIATRFAVTPRLVQQRIAIGSLPDDIITALRQGKINLETAQAFTVSNSAERQIEVFKSLQHFTPYSVRRSLTAKSVAMDDVEGRFVGLDAYVDAGGRITQDLFENRVFCEDPDLLNRLFEDKLQSTLQGLKDDGWQDVQLLRHADQYWRMNLSHETPKGEAVLDDAARAWIAALEDEQKMLQSQQDAVDQEMQENDDAPDYGDDYFDREEQLEQIAIELKGLSTPPFTDKQKKKLVALVVVGHSKVEIKLGLKKPSKDKATGDQPSTASDEPEAPAPEPVREGFDYSDAVQSLLAMRLQDATQLAMVTMKPALAARMGLAARLLQFLDFGHHAPFNQRVGFNHEFGATLESGVEVLRGDIEPLLAEQAFANVLAWLEAQTPEELINIEAMLAAAIFNIGSVKNPDGQFVAQMIDPDVAATGFRADETFLKLLSRGQLHALIADCDPTSKLAATSKKPLLLAGAITLAGKTGWLPKPLRMPNYKGPGSDAWIEALSAAPEPEAGVQAEAEGEVA